MCLIGMASIGQLAPPASRVATIAWPPCAHRPWSHARPRLVRVQAAGDDDTCRDSPAGPLTRVTLRRPLGIVFGERGKGGAVVVEEVASGGNAARSGKVEVGDELVRCSAYVLKSGTDAPREGYGDRPYDNWEQTMFDCRGVDFKTVMVALESNNPRWGITQITLELQRGSGAAQETS